VVSLEFGELKKDERETAGICIECSVGRVSSSHMVLLIQLILCFPAIQLAKIVRLSPVHGNEGIWQTVKFSMLLVRLFVLLTRQTPCRDASMKDASAKMNHT
jgi:hypothetical protein